MNDIRTDLAAAADAVTGPGTPDQVKVSRPTTAAVWTVFLGLAVTSLLSLIFGGALVWAIWPATPDATHQRLFYLGWALLATIGCNALFAVALATPWIGRVTAQALGSSISIDGRAGG